MAWFDAEHANLLAAQRAAAAPGWHAAVWHLAWGLHTFQNRRGLLPDRLAVWQAALVAAAHLPDPAAGIRAHRLLGDVPRAGALPRPGPAGVGGARAQPGGLVRRPDRRLRDRARPLHGLAGPAPRPRRCPRRGGHPGQLGYIEFHTGHHSAAIRRYRAALARLGEPHAALGHRDDARAVWREALEMYRQQDRAHDAERVQRQLDALDGDRRPTSRVPARG